MEERIWKRGHGREDMEERTWKRRHGREGTEEKTQKEYIEEKAEKKRLTIKGM